MTRALESESNIKKLAELCGYRVESFYSTDNFGAWVYFKDEIPNADGEFTIRKWNPFISNSDCFEMAINLKISIDPYANSVYATCMNNDEYCEMDILRTDIMLTARTAICKCALSMQKGEKDE